MAVERALMPTFTRGKTFSPEFLIGARIVTTVPTGDPSVTGRTILLKTVRSFLSPYDLLLVGPGDPLPTEGAQRGTYVLFLNGNSVVYNYWVPLPRSEEGDGISVPSLTSVD